MGKLNILRYFYRYKRLYFHSRDRLQAYQKRRIEEQLIFVNRYSKYYHDLNLSDFNDYPIMNKTLMMDNFDDLNTVGVSKTAAMDLAISSEKSRDFSGKCHGITVGLSSGTSGNRGLFLVSDDEKDKWLAYLLARFMPDGIFTKARVAFFMRANSNLYETINTGNISFHFFDIYQDMNKNINELKRFGPDIIVGQPSVLLVLCDYCVTHNVQFDCDRIVSIAETLEERDADFIKAVFHLDIIDQVYQCTEGCLGFTCPCGRIHLNEDLIYVEKEYLDNSRFIPIITDFERKSQPIIRYRLNDILIERHTPCECGSVFTCIEKIEGREDDVFLFDGVNGGTVIVYPDFVRRCVLFAEEKIFVYRVVQHTDKTLSVFINANEPTKMAIKREFEIMSQDMGFVLPEISFQEYVTSINKKMKRVEREYERS